MTPVLSVENLSIAFTQEGRSLTVVNGVSYHINPGEVVALVGESGSGKSVTALSSMKLLGRSAQISGKTHYNGQDISDHDEGSLRQLRGNEVSFIFQEPMTSLNPLHTIEKQLRESLNFIRGSQVPLRVRGFCNCWNVLAFRMQKHACPIIHTNSLVDNDSV